MKLTCGPCVSVTASLISLCTHTYIRRRWDTQGINWRSICLLDVFDVDVEVEDAHCHQRSEREKKMSKVTKGCHVLDFQKSNHVRIARAYTDRCVIPSLAAGEFVLWCLLTARTPLLCCSEEAEIQTLRFPGSFSSTAQEQAATPRCWSWSC